MGFPLGPPYTHRVGVIPLFLRPQCFTPKGAPLKGFFKK
ncbi:hypothetical protein EBI_27264 [Enterocytozoon bieneusi H348]|nr:hypothetical protein EBI_27264 [Enterocytozoon bieneusi H348]|eukprot:XP_002651314.1 hypothetical protein EBI_27264 [Enterocytozoon bieneusi H348]